MFARCITVMSGCARLNGHTFCEGIGQLELPTYLRRVIYPVIRLMSRAIFRSRYQVNSRGATCLGQLIDMYHYHQATSKHDKVYASLRFSSDDPSTPSLKSNYNLPWNVVYKQTISYIFPENCLVKTWPNRDAAVIKGKGWVLARIESVNEVTHEYGHQSIQILHTHNAQSRHYHSKWGNEWKLPASAASIQEGDLICLLEGASYPSVVRLCRDYFIIVTTTALPQENNKGEGLNSGPAQRNDSGEFSSYNILLLWEISTNGASSFARPLDPTELNIRVPEYQETPQEAERRLADMAVIM